MPDQPVPDQPVPEHPAADHPVPDQPVPDRPAAAARPAAGAQADAPRHPARDPWILAQFALAAALAALSLLGVIASLAFDAVEFTFTFQGAIQAFAIFPGLVLSLIVNALLMRAHRARGTGITRVEAVMLAIEFALIALLLLCHFWSGPGGELFGIAILAWPVAIVIAVAVGVVAGVTLGRRAAGAPGPAPVSPAP
ncbi:MAG: hypothetical protein J0G30_12120 [Actinomycetales bacterium]|nr:hypothetical protein [Actinomycetales bacterium]